jgi:branched-chain amino acid transport system ATP-binding protein
MRERETAMLLDVKGLSKHFGGLKAVHEVSFAVEKGEILGIIGPNGAGKTTLFNLISGFHKPTSGEIVFDGSRTDRMKSHQIARLGIGRTFQIVRPFKGLSVIDNVRAACGCPAYGGLTSLFASNRSAQATRTVTECLKMVGLSDHATKDAQFLPLGMLRRLEIARALALSPQLILLDESFSGLSREEEAALIEVVRDLRNKGVTFIVIEHNMQVATSLCFRLIVLDYGQKLTEGEPGVVVSDPRVIEAYLGEECRAYY